MRNVLFICTGNYYRSRFAEIHFNHLTKYDYTWTSFSRGLSVENINNVGVISPYALKKLNSMNIPLPLQLERPSTLSVNDLISAELIIALDENEHRPIIKKRYPEWENQIDYWQIRDIHLERPEQSLEKLEREIIQLWKTIKK